MYDIQPIHIDLDEFDNKNINFFQEAVFTGGRQKLKPIDNAFKKVQEALKKEIGSDGKSYSPEKFYKNPAWKDLEDAILKIFGFRFIEMAPQYEKAYGTDKTKMFVYVNAGTVMGEQRFAIEGLVTKDGFYDRTKSLIIQMIVGNQLLLMLEPEELTAIFLHEFGHNIDPALIDINYNQINEYVKYIQDTDKDKAKKEEKGNYWLNQFTTLATNSRKITQDHTGGDISVTDLLGLAISFIGIIIQALFGFLQFLKWHNPFNTNVVEVAKRLMKKTKENIKSKGIFSKFSSTEAFADNLPRMYGYGKQLISALNKLDNFTDEDSMKKLYGKDVLTRSDVEKCRCQFFSAMIESQIKDVHKTTVHRYYSMLKEYLKELKDSTIPANIKKEIKADLDLVMESGKLLFKSPDKVRNKIYFSIFSAIKETDPDVISKDIKTDFKLSKILPFLDKNKDKEKKDKK